MISIKFLVVDLSNGRFGLARFGAIEFRYESVNPNGARLIFMTHHQYELFYCMQHTLFTSVRMLVQRSSTRNYENMEL